MSRYSLDKKIIKGIKVIGAREGSIVLDLLVLYSDSVTSRHAFNHLVETVVRQSSGRTALSISFSEVLR